MAKTFEDVLAGIREAGEKGLSPSSIAKIWPAGAKRGKEERLAELNADLAKAVRGGLIRGPFKRGNSKLYFASGHGPTVEKVSARISELVLETGVKLISKAKLEKFVTGPDSRYFTDALRSAVSEGLIAELTSGNSKLYLHRDVAAERFGFKIDPSPKRDPAPAPFGMAEFLPIYRRLKEDQGGLPAVRIFDVVRLSGADRAEVHNLLISEQKSGRVTIHQSNSIDLPREVIDAGIRVEGFNQPYINVVVKELP